MVVVYSGEGPFGAFLYDDEMLLRGEFFVHGFALGILAGTALRGSAESIHSSPAHRSCVSCS